MSGYQNGMNIRDLDSDDHESSMDKEEVQEEARQKASQPPDVEVIHPDISYIGYTSVDKAPEPKHLYPTRRAVGRKKEEVAECEVYNVSDVYPDGMQGIMHAVVWWGQADSIMDAARRAQEDDWWTEAKEARFAKEVKDVPDSSQWMKMNRRHFLIEAGGSEDPNPFPAKADDIISKWPVHYVLIMENKSIARHFRMPSETSEWTRILGEALALEPEPRE